MYLESEHEPKKGAKYRLIKDYHSPNGSFSVTPIINPPANAPFTSTRDCFLKHFSKVYDVRN